MTSASLEPATPPFPVRNITLGVIVCLVLALIIVFYSGRTAAYTVTGVSAKECADTAGMLEGKVATVVINDTTVKDANTPFTREAAAAACTGNDNTLEFKP